MTKNQIEYWKLRWTQYYEHILAKVKVAELEETKRSNLEKEKETKRHNRAVEAETARHNKREEYIDTQNMIINRGNLEVRWKELEEKQRAALVAEALNEKKYKLEAAKLLEDIRWHDIQADDMLQDRRVAIMSIKTQLTIEKNKNNVEWYKAAAQALKNGYDKAAVTALMAETKTYFSNKAFDALLKDLDVHFPELQGTKEAFGPATSDEILRNAKQTYDKPLQLPDKPKWYQKSEGTEASVLGFSDTENDKDSHGTVITGKTGAQKYDNHREAGSTKRSIETTSSRGTTIVYSPGTHHGPGFVNN